MATPDFAWTDANVAKLKELWAADATAKEIALQLGTTKNAVVGAARRHDLPMRRTHKTPPKRPGPSIDELTHRSCRWPIGDPHDLDFHFCGKRVVIGRPYCAAHCKRAYKPPAKKGKKAA